MAEGLTVAHVLLHLLLCHRGDLVLGRGLVHGAVQPAAARGGALGGKSGIEHHAEHVERDDAEDPRDLGFGHHVAVRHMEHGNDDDDPREHDERQSDIFRRVRKVMRQNDQERIHDADDDGKEQHDHQDDGERDNGKSAKNLFEERFHSSSSVILS